MAYGTAALGDRSGPANGNSAGRPTPPPTPSTQTSFRRIKEIEFEMSRTQKNKAKHTRTHPLPGPHPPTHPQALTTFPPVSAPAGHEQSPRFAEGEAGQAPHAGPRGAERRQRRPRGGVLRAAARACPRGAGRLSERGQVDAVDLTDGNGIGSGGVRVHDADVHSWHHSPQRRQDTAVGFAGHHRGGCAGERAGQRGHRLREGETHRSAPAALWLALMGTAATAPTRPCGP